MYSRILGLVYLYKESNLLLNWAKSEILHISVKRGGNIIVKKKEYSLASCGCGLRHAVNITRS